MSTRIAVISDTHVGQRISAYPLDFLSRLRDFDVVIHAGDHSNLDALEELESLEKYYAVRGNMDEITVSSRLENQIVFQIEGINIGLIHGWGQPIGLPGKIRKKFDKYNPIPDIIIFGHTHEPFDQDISGIRMLNPGAFSGNLFSRSGSYAILTIDDKDVDWELVNVPS